MKNRLLAIALLSSAIAFGAISATVTDSSQAVVPGATVTVTNIGTNESRKNTSQNGAFIVSGLEPVLYGVSVTANDFKETVLDNIKVDTASTSPVNVSLQTRSVDTKVTVAADAAVVKYGFRHGEHRHALLAIASAGSSNSASSFTYRKFVCVASGRLS